MQKKHGKYFFKDNLKNRQKKSSASYFFLFLFLKDWSLESQKIKIMFCDMPTLYWANIPWLH